MRHWSWLVLGTLSIAGCLAAPERSLGVAASFDLPDLAGGRLNLDSLKGRVVVLDFWATWCGPCIDEIPRYADFWQKNRSKGVEVVGVVVDSGEPQEIVDFVREHRIAYRQVLGDFRIQEAYRVDGGLPTTFVIDRQGMIRKKILGAMPGKFAVLQKTVNEALAAAQP